MSAAEIAGLETLLKALESNWSSESAHQALLQFASEHALLPQAARFYRDNLENVERHNLSQKHLAAIQILALSALERSRTEYTGQRRVKKYSRYSWPLSFWAVLSHYFVFFSHDDPEGRFSAKLKEFRLCLRIGLKSKGMIPPHQAFIWISKTDLTLAKKCATRVRPNLEQ